MLLFLVAVGFAGAGAADAQERSASLTVSVRDARTGDPVELARVVLNGPRTFVGYTATSGEATYEVLPAGSYSGRVYRDGFQSAAIPPFEVQTGRNVTIDVRLARSTALKSIGRVTVSNSGAAVRPTFGIDDPLLGGSNASANGFAGDGETGIGFSGFGAPGGSASIDGHDSGSTGFSFDGVPLGGLGLRSAFHTGSAIFQSATVSAAATPAASGGSLNFHGLDPTVAWQGMARGGGGDYGANDADLWERGTLGTVGIAARALHTTSNDVFEGSDLLDGSGLVYPHDGRLSSDTAYLRFRAPLTVSDNLTATLITQHYHQGIVCRLFTGPLPCGYGPGNEAYGESQTAQLAGSFAIGRIGLAATLFDNVTADAVDERARVIGGTTMPYANDTRSTARGALVAVQIPLAARTSLALTGLTVSSRDSYAAQATPGLSAVEQSGLAGFTDVQASLNGRLGTGVRYQTDLHVTRTTGLPASLSGDGSITARVSRFDAITASFSAGGSGVQPLPLGTLSDPAALNFDCRTGTVFANGPGDTPSPSSAVSTRLAVQRRVGDFEIAATGYRTTENGGLLTTVVNGAALASTAALDPSYLDAASRIYGSSDGCGVPKRVSPADVYVAQPISGTRRVYEGVKLGASMRIGRDGFIEPYYNVQVAKATSGDERLSNPFSVVRIGSQLPDVPLHRAGLVAGFTLRSRLRLLGGAEHFYDNNAYNLAPFTLVSFGASVATPKVKLDAFLLNAFNVRSGPFGTTAKAVPLATVAGPPLPTIAWPLMPRRLSLQLSLPVGRPARDSDATNEEAAPEAVAFSPLPLSQTPPSAPLDPATDQPSCKPEALPAAKKSLGVVSAYVAALERARSNGQFPDIFPPVAGSDGTSVTYHRLGASYALQIGLPDGPSAQPAFFALLTCARVHFGTAGDLHEAGAFVPVDAVTGKAYLAFMPSQGLYMYVKQPDEAAPAGAAEPTLPKTPPLGPLALVEDKPCPSQSRPAAAHLLESLRRYVEQRESSGAFSPTPPDGWAVSTHTATAGWWIGLNTVDPFAMAAVESCAHVSRGSLGAIQARGYDAAGGAQLNFAPPLGLYEIAP